jgi:hypothetical protein
MSSGVTGRSLRVTRELTPQEKKKISELIKLPNSVKVWSAFDFADGLIVINYTDLKDPVKMAEINGLLIDLNAGIIYGDTLPYSIKFVVESSKDGKLKGYTVNQATGVKTPHTIDLSQVADLRKSYDGVYVRAVRFGGRNYWVSRKKIDLGGSRYIEDFKTFEEMGVEAGLPDINTLFDDSRDYSPFIYHFVINHPQSMGSSLGEFEQKPYGVYLGMTQSWSTDPEKCPYIRKDATIAGESEKILASIQVDPIEYEPSGSVIHPEEVTVEKFLRDVVNAEPMSEIVFENIAKSDERLMEGYPTMMLMKDATLYRVINKAHEWREEVRGIVANPVNGFFDLFDRAQFKLESGKSYASSVTGKDEMKKFLDFFPVLRKEGSKVICSEATPEIVMSLRTNMIKRLEVVALCYMIAYPRALRNFVQERISNVVESIERLADRIAVFYDKDPVVFERNLTENASFRVATPSKKETESLNEIKNAMIPEQKNGLRKSIQKSAIKNAILKIRGNNIYRLLRLYSLVKATAIGSAEEYGSASAGAV